MLIHGQVGPQSMPAGARGPIRQLGDGAVGTSDVHGRYMAAVLAGNVYIGANPQATSVTTQAGLSAASPALTLYNPVNSGVNLALLTVTVGVTLAPAAATVLSLAASLITQGAPTATTNANITNALTGANTHNSGQCFTPCVLRNSTAPIAYRYIGAIIAASSTNQQQIIDNVDGSIVIPPGGCISIQATTAVAVVCSFTWEEILQGLV